MKINYILFNLCLLIIVGCSGQPKEPFTPTKGEITITRQVKINNKNLIDSTLQEGFEKFMKIQKKKDLENIKNYGGPPAAESLFEGMARGAFLDNFNPYLMSKSEIEFNYRFEVFKIIYKITAHDKISRYSIIDTQKSSEIRMLSWDTTQTSGTEVNYRYLSDGDLVVKEYRNDKKTIKGYNCFKVVLESSADGYSIKSILYVTEEIKCLFHPIVKYKIF